MDGIEMTGWEQLLTHMGRVPVRMREESRSALRRSGEIVAQRAREISSVHPGVGKTGQSGSAQTIPGSIRVVPLGDVVRVQSDAPMARLYEFGNAKRSKGGRVTYPSRKSKTTGGKVFMHPVFGNRDVWSEQARYPFLAPALARSRRDIVETLKHAHDRSIRELGD